MYQVNNLVPATPVNPKAEASKSESGKGFTEVLNSMNGENNAVPETLKADLLPEVKEALPSGLTAEDLENFVKLSADGPADFISMLTSVEMADSPEIIDIGSQDSTIDFETINTGIQILFELFQELGINEDGDFKNLLTKLGVSIDSGLKLDGRELDKDDLTNPDVLLSLLAMFAEIKPELVLNNVNNSNDFSRSETIMSKPSQQVFGDSILLVPTRESKELLGKLFDFIKSEVGKISNLNESVKNTINSLLVKSESLLEGLKTTEGGVPNNKLDYLAAAFNRNFLKPVTTEINDKTETDIFRMPLQTDMSKEPDLSKERNWSKANGSFISGAGLEQVKLISEAANQKTVELTADQVISTGEVQQAPMSKVQQFALFVKQSPNQTVNQQQFIDEFQKIIAKSNFTTDSGGTQKLLIKLYPEHLGSLRIEILQKDNMMVAKILASNTSAKDLIESQVSSLKHSFTTQNIQIDKIEVSYQQQDFEQRSLQKEQQHQGRNHEQSRQEEKEEKNEFSFAEAFDDVLLNEKV